MILVFFIFLIISFILGLIFSKISINICNFKLNNEYEKLNTEFLIKIRADLYGLLPITILKLTQDGINIFGIKIPYIKILENEKLKDIFKKGLNKAKNDFKISSIKMLKPDLEAINLDLSIGTESFLMTTILIFIISTLLSFGIQNTIKQFDSEKYKYIIKPDFNERNKIIINLKGIFKIKTSNIIECVKLNNL